MVNSASVMKAWLCSCPSGLIVNTPVTKGLRDTYLGTVPRQGGDQCTETGCFGLEGTSKPTEFPPCHGLGPLPDTKLAEGTSRSVAAGGRDTSAPLQSLHPFFSLALLTLPWWPPVFLPAPQENRVLLDSNLLAEAFSMPRGQTTP